MRVGEAVISEPSSVSPTNVQVFYDPIHYPDMEKIWTDNDLRERMKPFYEKYLDFAKTPEIPILLHQKSEESVAFAVQVDDIVNTKTFHSFWAESILRDQEDLAGRHLEELLAHYAVHLNNIQTSSFEIAEQILESASRTYGNAPRQPNPHIIRKFLEKFQSSELPHTRRE